MSEILKSSTQAARLYSLSGKTAPKKKSLFFIRFRRTDTSSSTSEWQKTLGFFARSVDRPSAQPQVEEINQYNKKRLVQTGIKYQPTNIVFYDTQDSAAMQLWDEYSRYHFGDFNQDSETVFKYDATTDFYDNGLGFGFTPRSDQDEENDMNSGFFFDALEVYQVFGNNFIQYDLINPKISLFDPDELTYENHEISTISMSIMYEAIIYRNGGAPQSLDSAAAEFVKAAFDTAFKPDDIAEYDEAEVRPSSNINKNKLANILKVFNIVKDVTVGIKSGDFAARLKNQTPYSTAKGIIKTFGSYGFGTTSTSQTSTFYSDSRVSSILGTQQSTGITNLTEKALTFSKGGSIATATFDAAVGAFGSGSASNQFAQNFITNNLVSGVIAGAMLSSSTPEKQVTAKTDGSITMSSTALSAINAMSSATKQYGFNGSTDV